MITRVVRSAYHPAEVALGDPVVVAVPPKHKRRRLTTEEDRAVLARLPMA